MISTLDCVLCIQHQALDAARLVVCDENLCELVLRDTMQLILDRGVGADPPTLGTEVHRIVRRVTKNPDPYYVQKRRFNAQAVAQLDSVRGWINSSRNRFEAAARLAIAGNSIDLARGALDDSEIDAALSRALDQPATGSFDELRRAVDSASSILYLTDNAGEIAYDRLFIELLISDEFRKDVTVAVRGKPILNDALTEDAEEVGLTKLVPVISNGGDGLGTIFSLTSQEFNEKFRSSDLIIAKGLANYETLGVGSQSYEKKGAIAFLFKAKCPFIARRCGANLGDLVALVQ